jgi:hypothetical protein
VTFGLLIGLVVLITVVVGVASNSGAGAGSGPNAGARIQAMKNFVTFPQAYDRMLDFMLRFGGLLALLYGASIAGSEWGWGTFKSAVARGESRIGYMLSSFASVGLVVAIGLLVGYVIAVVAAFVGANLAGVSTSGLSDSATLGQLPLSLLRVWISVLEEAALGFTIATLARSQLAGIGVGIAFYFGESFAGLLLPDYVQYMPFAAANAAANINVSSGALGNGTSAALPADQALVMVAVWLVGALVVTALFSNRAEIAG